MHTTAIIALTCSVVVLYPKSDSYQWCEQELRCKAKAKDLAVNAKAKDMTFSAKDLTLAASVTPTFPVTMWALQKLW